MHRLLQDTPTICLHLQQNMLPYDNQKKILEITGGNRGITYVTLERKNISNRNEPQQID